MFIPYNEKTAPIYEAFLNAAIKISKDPVKMKALRERIETEKKEKEGSKTG